MKCFYMSGAGNDFMVIDARGLNLDYGELAKKLCPLRGADGFMAVEDSDVADFRLRFYNSDGGEAEMCGNGSRCICKFAFDNGIAGEAMTVETMSGIVKGWRLGENQYKVALNLPTCVDLSRSGTCAYVELGTPGLPHAVQEIPGLASLDPEALRPLAKTLRFDPDFPKGANVNFYDLEEPGKIRILTYERGVEDYTLACGTGSAACGVTLFEKGLLPGKRLEVQSRGGVLAVGIAGEPGNITELTLEGPAETLEILDV